MTTPSQSPSEAPGPNDPVEQPPHAEVSGVVMAPAPRIEASIPEIHFEHFPRTSFSPTQLSARRKRMRPVVTWTLGIALLLLAAAGIRSAFRTHETNAAPAAVVEEPPAHAALPAPDPETQPATDESAASGSSDKAAATATPHHKTSLSHRPPKKGLPGAH